MQPFLGAAGALCGSIRALQDALSIRKIKNDHWAEIEREKQGVAVMSVVRCSKCHRLISGYAEYCTDCGRITRQGVTRLVVKVVAVLIAAFALIMTVRAVRRHKEKHSQTSPRLRDGWHQCACDYLSGVGAQETCVPATTAPPGRLASSAAKASSRMANIHSRALPALPGSFSVRDGLS